MGNKQSKALRWNKIHNTPSDILYNAVQCISINQFECIIATEVGSDKELGLHLWNIKSGDANLIANYPSILSNDAKLFSICYDKTRNLLYCFIMNWIITGEKVEYQVITFDVKAKEFIKTVTIFEHTFNNLAIWEYDVTKFRRRKIFTTSICIRL